MVKMKGLGRGLDALLAGDEAEEQVSSGANLRTLSVSALQPGKYQPRSYMDDAALQTLAESIKAQGIMQPILVREIAAEKYEIIAGERRWRASQIAGLTEVPVVIREIADENALAMALIENIQRENLNPLEEAQGIKRLIDEFSLTHEQAAQAVGRSRVAVSNLLRLLQLCNPVQDMLMQNRLDMGHARALIGLEPAQQVMLANKIVAQQLSVREAEKLAQAKPQVESQPKSVNLNRDVAALEESLSEQLGATVQIQSNQKGAGKLQISFTNLDQLQGIITRLSK